jgi:hypothetical protein
MARNVEIGDGLALLANFALLARSADDRLLRARLVSDHNRPARICSLRRALTVLAASI